MGVVIAGLRGGVAGVSDSASSDFAFGVLSGEVLDAEIECYLRGLEFDRTVTFVINNSCNLACRHCYLQVDRLTSAELSRAEWERTAASVLQQKVELICLSGKEVFLGNKGVQILKDLNRLRDLLDARTRFGVITNGTLIHRHRDAILSGGLDYLDISVDGCETDHDTIRGRGAFAMVKENLAWAAAELGDRLFVTLTVQQQNFLRLKEAVRELHTLGVRTVGCGFYHVLPYTDQRLALSPADLDAMFEHLNTLATIDLTGPLTLLLDLDCGTLAASLAYMRSEWFSPANFRLDTHGDLFSEVRFDNGLRMQFRFTPTPSIIFKSERITPEGNLLAAEDTLNAKLYPVSALGNVRDYDYNLGDLYAEAAGSQRVSGLLRNYFERIRPQFVQAFGARYSYAARPVAEEFASA